MAVCLGRTAPQLESMPWCSGEEVLGPQSQFRALYLSAPPMVGLAEVHMHEYFTGKIQQLHQWFVLRHRMPWKEKSCNWLWSTWPFLKEGTSYSTSVKPRAGAKLPVGADLLWKQAHVLSLCPCLACAFEQELNAVWAFLNKHGMFFSCTNVPWKAVLQFCHVTLRTQNFRPSPKPVKW